MAADGQFYTCLFASTGHDLRALLRSGLDDEALLMAIREIWKARNDRYSEIRSAETTTTPKAEMSKIGG